MTCPGESQLAAFLDEAVPPSEAGKLAEHIDGCPACQARLDDLITTEVVNLARRSVEEPAKLTDADQSAVDGLIQRLQSFEAEPQNAGVSNEKRTWSHTCSSFQIQLPFRLDRYTLDELVGEGATGRLYRAVDEQLGRQVAVKILRPELAAIPSARSRFEREAQACAALNHDHIVSIHHVEADRLDQPPYLVMEFIDGCSIQEWMAAAGDDHFRAGVEWIRQAALALQAAHDAGIVHRDVKPSNLLIDESTGRLRVADFGLARLAEAEESLTADDAIAGTPAYMSPEQITNPTNVTGLSDVYSLGVVLYEILTGERPFRGTVRMVLQQVQNEEPVRPRRLNDRIARDLETICLKAMAKEQRSRYQSAQAFADDLKRWLTGRAVLARPVGPAGRVWRWCKRDPRLAGAAAIVATVLAGGAIDWGNYRQRAVEEQIRREWEADVAHRDELLGDAAERERVAEHRWQLAMNALRETLVGIDSTGKQPAPDRAFLTLTEDVVAALKIESSADSIPALLQVAELGVIRADHESRSQNHDAAIAGYEQARSILALPKLAAFEEQVRLELAVVTSKLAKALNRTESPRALVVCEEACRLNEKLADTGERTALVRLASSYGELGDCQIRLDEFEDGVVSIERQCEAIDRLVEANANDTAAIRSSGRSWLKLATAYASSDDWAAAASSAASATTRFRRLRDRPSGTDEDQLELAEAELLCATSTLAAGRETLNLDSLNELEDRIRSFRKGASQQTPALNARADSLLARCRELIEAASGPE